MQNIAGDSVRIRVNGAETDACAGLTVGELLMRRGVKPDLVAVQLNGEVVERSRFAAVRIQQGDALEIVQFVGGG